MATIKIPRKPRKKNSHLKPKVKKETSEKPKMTPRSRKVQRTPKYQKDFYQRLRVEIEDWLNRKVGRKHKWAEFIMLAPDLFHLLIRLVIDPKIPLKEKGMLALAIVYFIAPIDLIPEALIGPGGYVDDVALSCYVLDSVVNNTSASIVRKHWGGDKDILEIIKLVLKNANKMIGSGLWLKLKKMVPGLS